MAFFLDSKKRRFYARITTVIFLVTLFFSIMLPLKYSATISVVVVSKGQIDLEQYQTSDVAENLARNLSEVVYTSSFFYKAMDTGYDISPTLFSKEENKRKKEWERAIKTKVVSKTGILKITAYDESSYTARELANAVAYALTLHGNEYTTLQNTEIKVIDEATVSKFPVKPNLILIGLLGIALGLAVSYTADVLLEDRRARAQLAKKEFPAKEKKKKVKVKEPEEKTVEQLLEKDIAEQAFEQAPEPVQAPQYSQYASYPKETLEVMPRE